MSVYSFELQNVSYENIASMIQRLSNFATIEAIRHDLWRISGSGILAEAQYDSDKKTLKVTILEKPFIVSVGLIKEKVLQALQTQESSR